MWEKWVLLVFEPYSELHKGSQHASLSSSEAKWEKKAPIELLLSWCTGRGLSPLEFWGPAILSCWFLAKGWEKSPHKTRMWTIPQLVQFQPASLQTMQLRANGKFSLNPTVIPLLPSLFSLPSGNQLARSPSVLLLGNTHRDALQLPHLLKGHTCYHLWLQFK